jgi:hypothetical protein
MGSRLPSVPGPARRRDDRIASWVGEWTTGRVQTQAGHQGARWPAWCNWPDCPALYDAIAVAEAWWALRGYGPTRNPEIDVRQEDSGLWSNLHLVGDVVAVPAEVLGAVWATHEPPNLETLVSASHRYLREGVPKSHLKRGTKFTWRVVEALGNVFEDIDQLPSPQAEPLGHLLALGRGIQIPTRNSEVHWRTAGWQGW